MGVAPGRLRGHDRGGTEEAIMSTLPGHDAWRDAGLIDQEGEIVSLVEEHTIPPDPDPTEYHPGTARPDVTGDADEADVVEQAALAPQDDAE
jgi:hypothetical protein